MKTIIQIAVAAILLTASVQGGRAAFKHYQFVDAIQEAMLFAGSRTEEQIADRVIELAGDHQIPLEPGNVSVQRAAVPDHHRRALHRHGQRPARILQPPAGTSRPR